MTVTVTVGYAKTVACIILGGSHTNYVDRLIFQNTKTNQVRNKIMRTIRCHGTIEWVMTHSRTFSLS